MRTLEDTIASVIKRCGAGMTYPNIAREIIAATGVEAFRAQIAALTRERDEARAEALNWERRRDMLSDELADGVVETGELVGQIAALRARVAELEGVLTDIAKQVARAALTQQPKE